MKILFIPSGCLPFHARSLEERPLGGIETAVIRLAEALAAKGHQVIVASGFDNPPLSEALYVPFRCIQELGSFDAVIAVRDWKPVVLKLETKVRLLWTGDSYDQPQTVGIGDQRVVERLDALLPVSSWHKERLCRESGFPLRKAHVLRNGVHMPYFAGEEERVRKRLIYSSTPYRGLVHLPEIYLRLKALHPDAELHIFSGYAVYSGATGGYDSRAQAEFAQLREKLEALPECTVHGNVTQAQLAREFMRSAVLAYPNTFEETSCITALEAQAAGCPIVTTALGALPETVGEAGILIEDTPGSETYTEAFVRALDRLLSDDDSYSELSKTAIAQAEDYEWSRIAEGFSDFLTELLKSQQS